MRILSVIPITNNPRIDELTYFSLQDVPLGSLVQVPMRNKEIPALVIRSENANDMKALLRGGDFSLKRIGVSAPRPLVPSGFITAAVNTAAYYATSTGSLLSALLPKAILTNSTTSPIVISNPEKNGTVAEIYALQASLADRVTFYNSTMREAFAKKESLLIVTPTVVNALSLHKELSKRLEERVFVLTSNNTKAKQLKIFREAHASIKPVLLIATAKYAQLFREDVSTVIIEDEANQSYNTLKRPYINTAEFIKTYAKLSGLKLILGSTVLSSKTHLALTNGTVLELAPPTSRARSDVRVNILDVRAKQLKPDATAEEKIKYEKNKKPFTAISDALREEITENLSKGKKVFILAPRQGLAPLTACRDCRTPILCNSCDTPVTLRKKKDGGREFLCYKCGETKETDTTCAYCNSWRLDTLGIGIEMIEDELAKIYKNISIQKVDKQTTKTDKQVRDVVNEFSEVGGILLGTPLVLPFLVDVGNVDMSAIASLDAMLSVPSFEIDERVFALILKVKDLTRESLSIQTRMSERSVLTRAKSGDIAGFIREELVLRKALKYPPYTVMIKITKTGSKRQIIEDFQNIMPSLEPYGPRVFKQFYQITPSKFALHALLRIPTKDYPLPELIDVLKSIQPMFEVRVDVE